MRTAKQQQHTANVYCDVREQQLINISNIWQQHQSILLPPFARHLVQVQRQGQYQREVVRKTVHYLVWPQLWTAKQQQHKANVYCDVREQQSININKYSSSYLL